MRVRALVIAAAIVAAGCSSVKPVPIYPDDICFNCRRVIGNVKLAGEVVDQTGHAFKFKSTTCMVRYLKGNPASQASAAAIYVTDYRTGRLIPAENATFVPTVVLDGKIKTPNFIAYQAAESASDAAAREQAQPMTWQQVFDQVAVN